VATRLARLVSDAGASDTADTAALRLRLRVAVRDVRRASTASKELHAALHLTKAAAAAATAARCVGFPQAYL
jgi:hypothetical protein